jgi:DNA helicase II / ATP-dependent DNA helicase PcrA
VLCWIDSRTGAIFWGSKETKIPSQFLKELPSDLIKSDFLNSLKIYHQSDIFKAKTLQTYNQQWSVGDRLIHPNFGIGKVTHILGSRNNINLAIKFLELGQKIINPRVTLMEKID